MDSWNECTYCGKPSQSSRLKSVGRHRVLEDECLTCEAEILCYDDSDDSDDDIVSSWLEAL